MPKIPYLQRRLEPSDSWLVISISTLASIALALAVGGLLFIPFDTSPVQGYLDMLQQSFGSLRGIGFTLVNATPLIFVGLATIVAWKSGFFYLGFEGALLIGAAVTVWMALLAAPGMPLDNLPAVIFFLLVFLASFIGGGIWSGIVGWLKARYGGNEVLISLMMNYLAVFLVNYLVSGPLRAPGDLPQTLRIPNHTVLPFIIPDTRAHAGFLVALVIAVMVSVLMYKTPLGYELIVSGLSQRAARYSGINVRRRLILASFLTGGLASFAGLVEVLGVQYRLMDGLGLGTGFLGVVAALLGKLSPLGVIISSILYAGMEVGADAMQRRAGLPGSVIFTVQSLIVLFILASDVLRYYRLDFRTGKRGQSGDALRPTDAPETTKV